MKKTLPFTEEKSCQPTWEATVAESETRLKSRLEFFVLGRTNGGSNGGSFYDYTFSPRFLPKALA